MLFGNFIKSHKVSSHQSNSKTNDAVLLLSHSSAKTESENNRRAAQGTVTELHLAAH